LRCHSEIEEEAKVVLRRGKPDHSLRVTLMCVMLARADEVIE